MKIQKRVTALLLACLLAGAALSTGCNESDTSGGDSTASTVSGLVQDGDLQLFYDSTGVPDDYANVIAAYFRAIAARDYAAYSKLVFPVYLDAMEQYLQEKNGYGMTQSFQNRLDKFNITESNHYAFTQIKMTLSTDDAIDDYLAKMNEILGNDFAARARSAITESHVILFSVNAVSDDMDEETTVVDDSEMIVVRTGDGLFVCG